MDSTTIEILITFGLPAVVVFGLPFVTTLWNQQRGFVVALVVGFGVLAIYLGFLAVAEGQGGMFAFVAIGLVGIPGLLLALLGWVAGLLVKKSTKWVKS